MIDPLGLMAQTQLAGGRKVHSRFRPAGPFARLAMTLLVLPSKGSPWGMGSKTNRVCKRKLKHLAVRDWMVVFPILNSAIPLKILDP